ncbi:hypothetical protein QL093DRAFT_2567483 [Fusarium oxysporum]|nr:hypothetical protein QL093DRAFT_2567483 [Fusarium oxysporum]
MSIAIAGSGDLARYMVEEFPRAGLDLVILTRTYKPHLAKEGVQQFMTDYSSTSLDEALRGCKALISTIVDMSQTYVDIHLQLLAACRRSASCKRFIPSEFAGNTRDYPDQPAYFRNINERVRQALKQQDQVEWTIVCIGFFADYFVPASNRYIRNMREGSLIDFDNEKFSVPGSLQDSIDITLARDVVKGLVALRPKFTVQVSTLNEVIDTLMPGNSVDDITFAQLQLYSASGAARCPEREVEKQEQEYFRDIHFHTLQEIWNQFNDNKTIIF